MSYLITEQLECIRARVVALKPARCLSDLAKDCDMSTSAIHDFASGLAECPSWIVVQKLKLQMKKYERAMEKKEPK